MAVAYLTLYNSALEIREFFGLRDFYRLIDILYYYFACIANKYQENVLHLDRNIFTLYFSVW